MPDTGYNWGAWDYAEVSAADVDATALADEAQLTTDEIDLDVKIGCEVAIQAVEDNTGAIDGDLLIYVLREDGEGGWETIDDTPWGISFTPVQNGTRKKVFSIDPQAVGKYKILLDNDAGQELAVTVAYRTATLPAAS